MEPTTEVNVQTEISPVNLAKVLSKLELVAVEIEDWVIFHRSRFDMSVNEEPYLALQLYLNSKTGAFITRVWGRTCSRGNVANNESEIEGLCRKVFGSGILEIGEWG